VGYMVVAPFVRRFTGEERRARMATARAYARTGNVEAATRLAREVLDSDGKDIWAMLLLGSLEEPVRPEQAAAWYEKALAVNPTQVSALMGLARVKASLGDGSAAEPLYYDALKMAPGNSEAYEGLGDIYMARHAYETARKPYELAFRFGPDRPALLLKLGNAHQAAGDPCAAREFYSRSLALDSSPEHQSLALGLQRDAAALCAKESR
jgi:tetratricopeptide (TPR) repeat protein